MRLAGVFSDFGIAVICTGLLVATLAGAEPATDALSGHAAAARGAADAIAPAKTEPVPDVAAQAASPPTEAVAPAIAAESSHPAPASEPAKTAVTIPAEQAPGSEDAAKAIPGAATLKAAKTLFGAVKLPSKQIARSIGAYSKGCLAGAQAIPVDGPSWQVMRLSRNRNWGHPRLVAMIEKLASDARAKDGWPGLLVGDLSQPRGGPMVSSHASHQVGLDVDIWLTPMPKRTLTRDERESMGAESVLSDDSLSVVREKWSDAHTNLIKRAASYPEVERVLVHPAIKQVLCYAASGDRSWLTKVRPYWGHDEHIHVRIGCPAGSAECHPQPAVPGDEGCGKELDDWLKRIENLKHPAPPLPIPPPVVAAHPAPSKEKAGPTLLDLPDTCRAVLAQDNPAADADIAEAVSVEKGAHQKAVADAEKAKSKAAATKTASASKLGGPKPAAAEHSAKPAPAEAAKTQGSDAKKN